MPPPAARILIIKPSSLGDVVHALPVLAGLRAAHPAAHIAWLVSNSFAPLLEGHPLLDEVIRFDRRHFGRMLTRPRAALDFLGFVRELRRRRFDLVVDLQGLFRSGFLAAASGAGRRIGFRAAREGAWAFYTQRVVCPPEAEHAVDRNLAVGRAMGLAVDPAAFPLGLRAEELEAAGATVSEALGVAGGLWADDRHAGTVVRADSGGRCARSSLPHGRGAERSGPAFTAVVPGARWASKCWPAERFATLVDGLHGEGAPPVVLLGGPDERATASAIVAGAHVPVVDLVGRTTLRELAAMLALARIVVCLDSGPMHIAAALGRPLVAIFGPTNPARTGPYSPLARVVQRDLPCVPCYRGTCPLGHHACLRELSAEPVLRVVREMLRGGPIPAETQS